MSNKSMPEESDKLILKNRSWYAWQMLPGYTGSDCFVPYCSPIFVEKVTPKKTGKGILQLEFVNVFYAEGVQGFTADLRIIKHTPHYLMADLMYGGDERHRAAIIGRIGFEWIKKYCPHLWSRKPLLSMDENAGADVSIYLSRVFGLK